MSDENPVPTDLDGKEFTNSAGEAVDTPPAAETAKPAKKGKAASPARAGKAKKGKADEPPAGPKAKAAPPAKAKPVVGDGPVLWDGSIPKDRTARAIRFRGPESEAEAREAYLEHLGASGTDHKIAVTRVEEDDGDAD